MQDLVVLVADKQMEFAIRGLLRRPEAITIRDVDADVYPHPKRDPGCRTDAHNFLRPLHADYDHALVLFDRHGCGAEETPVEELEAEVQTQLARNGWGNRAGCVVLDPELEIWVWSDSPEVDSCLGWSQRDMRVRDWLVERELWNTESPKPDRPKQALETVLYEVNRPRSAALFERLATRVGLSRCTDPAFARFCETLQAWFPREWEQ